LNDRKIGTRLLFAGNFLKQPCFAGVDIPHRVAGSLDHTDDAMRNAFWIGCYPGLDEARLRYSSDAIIEFCRNKRV
jgi:CDP-6-deoxy-D-xylo-4-hexulose-3-dehydrase